MEMSAKELAILLNGHIEGNANVSVSSLAKIEEAEAGSLSFVSNPKYENFIYTTEASILIVDEKLELDPQKSISPTLIRVENAYSSFTVLLKKYQELKQSTLQGIHQMSCISDSLSMGKEVYIGAFVYVEKGAKIGDKVKIFPNTYIGEGVTIGENTVIYAGVKIYDNCHIGANCVIHSGAVIGSDGFGFAPRPDGSYDKIPQIGNVIIEDQVEIGANTTIDRATLGATIIRKGVKLDNLVQVAHNAEIGENTVIAAQTGVSGSTKIGKNCMIGGQVGFVGHIHIAAGTKINAQSGIARTVKAPKTILMGTPALPYRDFMRSQVIFKKLPELDKQTRALEKRLKDLEKELAELRK